MAHRFELAYAALVVVAATNREMTAVLLLAAWFGLRPRQWRWGLAYGLLAAAVLVLLRLGVGDMPNHYTLASVFAGNTLGWALQNLMIYGGLLLPLLAAGLLGWRTAPHELRRLLLVVGVVYLPLWAVLAAWQETRLLMPLIILILPMMTRQHSL